MSKKRRFIVVGAAAVACVGVALLVWALLPDSKVTKANYDRVAAGMTRAEVRDLFGADGSPFHGYPDKGPFTYVWESEDGSFAVIAFDRDQRVAEKLKWGESTETVFARLRRLLRRAWRW